MATLHVFHEVVKFIDSLSEGDSGKILAQLNNLEQDDTEVLWIKTLKGKIRELKVKQYRLIFFRIGDTIYVVDAFKKQSHKTPLNVISKAEAIYKTVKGPRS